MESEIYLCTSLSQSTVFDPLKETYPEQKISWLFWFIPYGLPSLTIVTQTEWFESFKPVMIDNFKKQTVIITVLAPFRFLNHKTSTLIHVTFTL